MSDNVKAAVERLRAVADSEPELSNGETYVLRDDLRALLAHLAKMEHQAARAGRCLEALRDLVSTEICPVDASDEWRAVVELLASEGAR